MNIESEIGESAAPVAGARRDPLAAPPSLALYTPFIAGLDFVLRLSALQRPRTARDVDMDDLYGDFA